MDVQREERHPTEREDVSTNLEAERLLGRRPTGVFAFDQPVELGYVCPVCKVPPIVDGEFDERLHWSEYNAFIWCEVCNVDWPSALCVPLEGVKDPERPWTNVGREDAVTVFLSTIQQAVDHAAEQARIKRDGNPRSMASGLTTQREPAESLDIEAPSDIGRQLQDEAG